MTAGDTTWTRVPDLREIEVVLVLAEELHFGRTASRLRLSSSRVSQLVSRLERRAGGRLFERTSRRVTLTPLGERLRDGLRPPYEEIHRLVRSLREVSGRLSLAVADLACDDPSLPELLGAFGALHPHCLVVTPGAGREAREPGGVTRALRAGEVDLAIAWQPAAEDGLALGPVVSRQARVLAVRRDHPLARRGHATARDLAEEPGGPAGALGLRGDAAEALWLIAAGRIAHPTVASFTDHYRHPDVVTVPLRGVPPLVSRLVWAAGEENDRVRAFADVVAEARRRTAAPPQPGPDDAGG
ncbi:hypothetical protein Misp01_21840 [Microtetraspora sp. NBRC 13810]|uniref:LysR family transcriptional regulator n=1 Tax=Microtetraspora sp. NBRC 13810 TaxID=3030990 RepID=UPI0024A25CA8|nr:LysR family transcriptional regulator [Microtetraspora sp. NBRC 13810]GLW07054.1 hypothetical protein Misp01_21840 [Microtetraspora sp. NBRC 13810]